MSRDGSPIELVPRVEVTRRDALKLIAAGIGALQAGCLTRAGDEKIVPYAADPPEHHPGARVRYTSALALDGFATGVVVETSQGRPTKIDGNPAHPANLGGSTPWMQARILDLYDPHRAKETRVDGQLSTWREVAVGLAGVRGATWLVIPPQSSPSLRALLERARAHRDLHVVYHAPLAHRAAYAGHALVYGRPVEQQLDLRRADVIVSLDSDFLSAHPMAPAWARATAARRTPRDMSRLWVCEPVQTATGTIADEAIALPASQIAAFATCVLADLARRGLPAPRLPATLVERAGQQIDAAYRLALRLADDLAAHRGQSAILVGDRQPPVVHALARWIDEACGNRGNAVTFTEPALLDGGDSLGDLAAAIRAHEVESLIIADTDPVYSAPRALGLGELIRRVPLSLCAGLFANRTSAACGSRMPLAHEFETWSDPRAWDGTIAIGQPMLRPRFEVASVLDLAAVLAGDLRDARTIVRDTYRARAPADSFEDAWTDALRTGVVPGSRAADVDVTPTWSPSLVDELARMLQASPPDMVEISLAPSPQLHDGRFAPNAWLEELPHPITKQTWGNAALLGPGLAARLDIVDGQVVELRTPAGAVLVPAIVVPGAADGSITLELGYGQTSTSPIALAVGVDAMPLVAGDSLLLRGTIRATSSARPLVRTQTTMTEEGRELAPVLDLAKLAPDTLDHLRGDQPSLLPPRSREGVQWGMSIDTSICTGCSSCMIACQAENNVPTVGPADVARGRHMGWIRIDRYVTPEGPIVNEPMLCQHCEHAPCEYVCPVGATAHSHDGLNEQVYNRCVGTRFCSNNCPYKVRRFNWFQYETSSTRSLQYNPDVTVRSRGVMEKCTYCVQRIRGAEHDARVEHRRIRVAEVVTACMQACPTGAIQFGQLDERGTVFAAMRTDARRFAVLHELGTRPRTEYLAKVRNPKVPR